MAVKIEALQHHLQAYEKETSDRYIDTLIVNSLKFYETQTRRFLDHSRDERKNWSVAGALLLTYLLYGVHLEQELIAEYKRNQAFDFLNSQQDPSAEDWYSHVYVGLRLREVGELNNNLNQEFRSNFDEEWTEELDLINHHIKAGELSLLLLETLFPTECHGFNVETDKLTRMERITQEVIYPFKLDR
jgi:hypothetical protein